MSGGVGGALSDGCPYPYVCRARHMFLKVSQTYHVINRLTSLRPSRMEAKGVAVLQRGIGDDASEGSSPAEAGYRESTG